MKLLFFACIIVGFAFVNNNLQATKNVYRWDEGNKHCIQGVELVESYEQHVVSKKKMGIFVAYKCKISYSDNPTQEIIIRGKEAKKIWDELNAEYEKS